MAAPARRRRPTRTASAWIKVSTKVGFLLAEAAKATIFDGTIIADDALPERRRRAAPSGCTQHSIAPIDANASGRSIADRWEHRHGRHPKLADAF
ncbi:hypothetical protein [Streptomyces platensis]|uniref:hypothetical protein n=1 Tax=Streptomyces platensis TaxID=58346 RepID=UPI0036B9DA51